jgi:hypothetical protein
MLGGEKDNPALLRDSDAPMVSNQSTGIESCVVWTSIPIFSWVLPWIGHVGISDSLGTVHDFQGDFTIGRGQMLFGDPKQKWVVPIDRAVLDEAILDTATEFRRVPYSFFCSNCHFFVASCLQRAGLPTPCGCSDWRRGATAKIIWSIALHGRSISVCDFITIWIPPVIFVGLILFFVWLRGSL